jgi:hypothetical protein
VTAVLLAAVLFAGAAACSGGRFFGKQYEYEEDLTLAIDGSATLVVNASLASLAVLRGLPVSTDPNASVDRDAIAALFQSPVTAVSRVGRPWRRSGRRFVQVRIDVPDVRTLSQAAPFAWSTYQFGARGDKHVYEQTVGPSAFKPGSLKNYGWDGSELVAFRLHLPSKIIFHNARDVETNETSEIARGNILSWEQRLTDRLEGRPVDVRVEMESQSILHRTLWLFAGAFAAAVLVLVLLIVWTVRKGRDKDEPAVN